MRPKVEIFYLVLEIKLPPNKYSILIRGVEVDSYEIVPGFLLAVNLGNTSGPIEGKPTKDPAFNLEAFWITPDKKQQAQKLGYMVVDISTAIITHLSEIIKKNLYLIVGRQEVIELLDKLT